MRSRSGALKASSAISGQTPRSYSRSRAPAKARCTSSSAGIGMRGFLEQHGERWHVGVPLDERRPWTEERQRLGIKRPHLGRDPRAVIVDADRAAVFELAHPVPGKMELGDRLRRQRAQISERIEAVV